MDVTRRLGRISVLSALALVVAVGSPLYATPQASASRPTAQKAPAKPVAKPASTRTRTSLTVARARAATKARARAAAAERTLRAAMTARFKRDMLGNLIPDVRAAAAVIFDPQTGTVL